MTGPSPEELRADLAAALIDGNAGKALEILRTLPEDLRLLPEARAHEADLLGKLGHHAEEVGVLTGLVAENPSVASLHLSLANAYKTMGSRDEAIAHSRSALAMHPSYGKAWWMLAELKNYTFGDAEIGAMEQALAAAGQGPDHLHLNLALGRAFEQRGVPDRAFAHYAEAKAATAATLPAQALSVSDRVTRAIAALSPEFFGARDGFGDPDPAPIFIVGLHRSGSTLVEQILASHSEIEATSELPIVSQLMRSVALDPTLPGETPIAKLATLDEHGARALGTEYLTRAGHYRQSGKPRFIDKMPANWLHLGLIRLILPNAVIIDARRHPMAAGFSNFRQHYDKGAGWTASLAGIGTYYRDYLRFMRHFDAVQPGVVHRVINEQLIDDFEPEVRRLLAHVGVDFEASVLEFHRSDRPVRSASAEQVRRPINRDGVDQWRAFEPWLGPLKEALGPALEDWLQ